MRNVNSPKGDKESGEREGEEARGKAAPDV